MRRWIKVGESMRARFPKIGKQISNRPGIALIGIIVMLFFFTSLGASLLGLVYSRLTSVVLEADRLKAEYLAEAGMAKARLVFSCLALLPPPARKEVLTLACR